MVVDLELTAAEARAVDEANAFMSGFEQRRIDAIHNMPFAFSTRPSVEYAPNELRPQVHAVAEIFGVVFNQGVNEMQTLANMSSSRDVLRQAEINMGSLGRFITFYCNYKAALEYQLVKRTPELIDILNTNAVVAQATMSMHNNSNNTFSGGATSRSSAAAAPPAALKSRRKSLRSSVSTTFMNNTNEGLTAAAEALKAKVLNANDRYVWLYGL